MLNYVNVGLSTGAVLGVGVAATMVADGAGVAGVASGLVFGLSPTVWYYATHWEVFGLNNAFGALILVLLCCATREGAGPAARSATIVVGALVAGLALTHQHTIVLFLLPTFVWLAPHRWSARLWVSALVAGCLGLSPYAFLALSSRDGWARFSWGDQSTINGFLTHLFRAEYGTFRLASSHFGDPSALGTWTAFGTDAVEQSGWLVIALAAYGGLLVAGRAAVEGAPADGALASMWVLYNVVFNGLANLNVASPFYYEVTRRFWILPHLLTAVFAGVAVADLAGVMDDPAAPGGGGSVADDAATENAREQSRGESNEEGKEAKEEMKAKEEASGEPSTMRKALPGTLRPRVVGLRSIAVLACLGVWLIGRHFVSESHVTTLAGGVDGTGWVFHDFGVRILAALPPGAALIVSGDQETNSLRYLQACEGLRPDVDLLTLEAMTYGWFARTQVPHFGDGSGTVPPLVWPGDVYLPSIVDGPALETEGRPFGLGAFLRANVGPRDVYAVHIIEMDRTWVGDFVFVEMGDVDRVVPVTEARSGSGSVSGDGLAALEAPLPPASPILEAAYLAGGLRPGSWEEVLSNEYWSRRLMFCGRLARSLGSARETTSVARASARAAECVSLLDRSLAVVSVEGRRPLPIESAIFALTARLEAWRWQATDSEATLRSAMGRLQRFLATTADATEGGAAGGRILTWLVDAGVVLADAARQGADDGGVSVEGLAMRAGLAAFALERAIMLGAGGAELDHARLAAYEVMVEAVGDQRYRNRLDALGAALLNHQGKPSPSACDDNDAEVADADGLDPLSFEEAR